MNRSLKITLAVACTASLVGGGLIAHRQGVFGRLLDRFAAKEAETTQTASPPRDATDVRSICRELAQRAAERPSREKTADNSTSEGSKAVEVVATGTAERPPSGTPSSDIHFASDIRPILVEHCYKCHGPDRQEGGLRLDQRRSAFHESTSRAAAIVPGDAARSALLVRVSDANEDSRMPQGGEPLSVEQISLLERWISTGANWPEEAKHWAFVKPQQAELPAVHDGEWLQNPIDSFVLARLEAEELAPGPEADRATLIRRLSLDLRGLPPTPEEVDAFIASRSPAAYEELVDRLLSSPQFGEKWAIRWLDLARYADTDGYDWDARRHMAPYRDWLIYALNVDLPFDQFTVEQLAGDLLPNPSHNQLAATGFMRNSAMKPDFAQSRFEGVIDRVNTLGTVWLGLSVGCAQCHNHKFDPITQKEYYQLYAFFNSTVEDFERKTDYTGGSEYVQSPLTGDSGTTLVMRERRDPLPTHVKLRGSFLADGEQVEPGTPAALHPARCGSENRLSLACWLIDDDNPLTARVTVNRYWESLFGIGLVRTSEDLGTRAEPPSHAELLDWLAVEFQKDWSMKRVLRLMVTSAAYRQTTRVSPELYDRDPQNRLVGRGPRFRVDAELIRDIALATSGLLSTRLGGVSVFPEQPAGISENLEFGPFEWVADKGDKRFRRGLYTYWKRGALYPSLSLFDAPHRATVCARRTRSSTPVQALVTLNDPVFFEAAVHLGERMVREGGASPEERVEYGFRLCAARRPTESELRLLTDLYHRELQRLQEDSSAVRSRLGPSNLLGRPDANLPERAAWSMVANVLLNLDETITKE